MLSLPFLDRDATRYLYISKANTKSICVIMQFNCICSTNLSSSICKLLYYKKFKSLAESQIRPGGSTKTLPTKKISKSNSGQQNIKGCVERQCDINSLSADCCFIWDLSKSILLEGFARLPCREPPCHFLLTWCVWYFILIFLFNNTISELKWERWEITGDLLKDKNCPSIG